MRIFCIIKLGDDMVVRKFNYFRFFIFIVILASIIFGIVYFVKQNNYKNSYEYKLLQVGYSLEEANVLLSNYDNKMIDTLLERKYNEHIIPLLSEKYFIYDKLDKYIEYREKNKKKSYSEIVQIINVEMDIDWLDNQKETDVSKNELMLVNRIYGLSSDYVPSDLVDIPTKYAYSGKKISNSVLEQIIKLIDEAQMSGYTFVVSDGYRSYKEQENIYNSYADFLGLSETDTFVARAGHSEYQTGLSFDLKPYNKVIEDVNSNEEHIWLKSNAHRFGFIFRFNAGQEHLTGFSKADWRLRYVGVDAATQIYNEGISFEEYYAYYVGE